MRAADAAYSDEGWQLSNGKDQTDVAAGNMWGADVLGEEGVSGVSRVKRCSLALLTLDACDFPMHNR